MGELTTILFTAFALGLVTNLHCIGMCGPIAMALPLNRKSKWTVTGGITSYSIGRSLGYATLGIIVGFIGISANLLGVLQWISIISGALIILFAWRNFYSFTLRSTWINKRVMRAMSLLLKNKEKKTALSRLFGIGLINAYLPCGMVYIALLGALNTGGIKESMLFMFVFGIGTLPGFIFLGVLKDRLSGIAFFNKKVVLAGLVSLVGAFMIVRGLNLGIPYISPKMEVSMAQKNLAPKDNAPIVEAKMSCCSKSAEDDCEKSE